MTTSSAVRNRRSRAGATHPVTAAATANPAAGTAQAAHAFRNGDQYHSTSWNTVAMPWPPARPEEV